MTSRERFKKTLLFGRPDKVPLEPGGPRESTLTMWHKQGLPEGVDYYEFLLKVLEIEKEKESPTVDLGVSFEMIPTFQEKVLEHKDGHYIVQDWMGAVTEISDKYDYTYIRSARDFVTRKWHKFPVENHKDWDEMTKRYKVDTLGRYPDEFDERCQALENRDYPMGLNINGPFWQLREWLGFENLCMFMIEDPDFIQEMINFWADFVLKTIEPVLTKVKLDSVLFSEDMAYKNYSMISPKMVKRFLLPVYERWVLGIKKSGCPLVGIDSDGYIGELIPLWIEVGINYCEPMEVAAGNDIVEYRKIYKNKMAYRGGIDKRAIAKGGKVIKKEVMRVVPPLLEDGGFIPSCDHGVPPDISWPNYVNYSKFLAKLTGWV